MSELETEILFLQFTLVNLIHVPLFHSKNYGSSWQITRQFAKKRISKQNLMINEKGYYRRKIMINDPFKGRPSKIYDPVIFELS